MWQDDPYETEIEEIRARHGRAMNVIPAQVIEECEKRVKTVEDPPAVDRPIVARELRRHADELLGKDALIEDLEALRTARSALAVHGWALHQGYNAPDSVHALLEEDDHNVRRWSEVEGQPPSSDLVAFGTYVLLARKYEAE